MGIEIELEGADDAASRINNLAESLSSSIGDALREGADLVVNYAQANAPVDTGNLRDSIEIAEESDTSITIVSSAGYSGFVEYGTRYMNAQPFFEPAIDQAAPEIGRLISDAIADSL